jgi:cytochrome c oxidase cbb3-type subunit 3/ubiquinol-cytochrome c reductase cytochrome c subunit
MMTTRCALALVLLVSLSGCDLPGRPQPGSEPKRPSQITDFDTLYAANCSGCHGDLRLPGAAIALADPVYLAFADDATLRRVAAGGVPGTSMPAFARSAGGSLTDEQIEILVDGMRSRWADPEMLEGAVPPRYASAPGDAERGARTYADRCAGCHGVTGSGGTNGGSVVDGAYLALVSDQALRTAVVVGRAHLGMPDWRGEAPRQPMSAQEVADVVAWLIAQRPEFPGQPYPEAATTKGPSDG